MKENTKNSQPSLPIGIIACFGGLLLQLVAGSFYQWGIVSIYITSYFKLRDSSLTLEQTTIVPPLMMFVIGPSMSLGLHLAKLTHPILILFIGQTLQAVTIFVSSYTKSFWIFVIFYGVIFGLGAGLCFMIPMSQINKYLPGRKMYVNGLILVGSGLGSIVFGQFSYHFINPENFTPLNGYYIGNPQVEEIALKLPTLMRWLSLMYLIIGYVGIAMITPVLIKNRQAQNELQINRIVKQPDNTKKNIENYKTKLPSNQLNFENQKNQKLQFRQIQKNQKNQQQSQIQQIQSKSTKKQTQFQKNRLHEAHSIVQSVSSKIFWVTNLMFLFGSVGIFLLITNYKTLVKMTIKDDEFLTLIGLFGGIGNGCSRFFWNLLFSKTGLKTVLLTVFTLSMIVFSTIRFTVEIKKAYLFEIFVIECCLGGLMVSTPTGLQSIYGPAIGSKIYGLYWETFSFSYLLAWIFVSQLTNKIGFNNIIYICLFMMALAFPVVVFLKFQGPWENDTTQLEFFVQRQIVKRDQMKAQQQKKIQQQNVISNEINNELQPQQQKNQKTLQSTSVNISPVINSKFSRISNKDQKTNVQDSNINLTMLKILSDSQANQPQIEREKQKYSQLPNLVSIDNLVDNKN